MAPPHQSADAFAWDILKIVVYENRLLPSISNEQIHDDPVRTFAAAHERGRKYESNFLHDVHNSSHTSGINATSALLQREATLVELRAQNHQPSQRGGSNLRAFGERGRSKNSTRRMKQERVSFTNGQSIHLPQYAKGQKKYISMYCVNV